MAQQQQWAEDDFDVPAGVGRMDLTEPVSGKTYIMYHGTTKKNAQSIKATGFRQSTDGMLGRGVYLSRDLQKASRYPIKHPESDRAVLKVSVNVGKVITINYQRHPRQKTWHDYGFDMAWVPPKCGMVRSGLEEDCVWDPSRIKIITIINPKPVESHSGAWGGYSSSDNDTNMAQQQEWAEDDFDVPSGVDRLGLTEPVSGRRYIMYHGTTKKNAQSIKATGFRQSTDGMLGRGVYLSRDLERARRYPINHPESDRAVLKVSVNVGKVIAIRYQGHPRQKTWHDYGFDTAWVPPKCGMVRSGFEEDCVWDPKRIQIIEIINPKPVESHSGAWGGYSSRDYSPPYYYDSCLSWPDPESDAFWMFQQFGSLAMGDIDTDEEFLWLENDPEP